MTKEITGVSGIPGHCEANECRLSSVSGSCQSRRIVQQIWTLDCVWLHPFPWFVSYLRNGATCFVVWNDVNVLLLMLVCSSCIPVFTRCNAHDLPARQLALCPQPAASWDKAITHRHSDADQQQTPSHPTYWCGGLLLLLFARAKFCRSAKLTVRLAGPLGGSTFEAVGGIQWRQRCGMFACHFFWH